MLLRQAGWSLVIAAGFLTGCATGTLQYEQLSAEPAVTGLTDQVLLNEIPFFPQEAYQCGPASLAMLMSHQGKSIQPSELVDQVFIESRQGSLKAEMLAATRRQGLLPYVHDTRFSTLLDQLEAGHPVLVFQNLGFGFYPVWHYAVVIGYDLDDKVITLHSGTTAGLERDFRRFELEWRGGDYWAMTLHQPGEFPANADASVYLEATVGLEQAEQFAAAARAYQGATERWPDQLIGWMGLGNTHYRLQQFEHAEQAYQRALTLKPDSAAAHHNLAWALMRQQDYDAALAPAQEADRLADEQGDHYRRALEAWQKSQE